MSAETRAKLIEIDYVEQDRDVIDRINDKFGFDQVTTCLDCFDDDQVVPIKRIRNIVKGPLECKTKRDFFLMLQDPLNFNQGLQRSMMKLALEGMGFPLALGKLSGQPVFRNFLSLYLREQGVYADVPRNQVRFSGTLEGEDVFNVHLAEVLGKELFLADIALSNPSRGDNGSMGGGVFDEIMDKIERLAWEYGYEQIGLMAASERNMRMFKKRGFVVEDNAIGELACERKCGYPMSKLKIKEICV